MSGYTNTLTWRVASALDNYERPYTAIVWFVRSMESRGVEYEDALIALSNHIRNIVRGIISDGLNKLDGIYYDILCPDYESINYVEIAEGFMEDYPRKKASRNRRRAKTAGTAPRRRRVV